MRTLVIAECGSCHDMSMAKAESLVQKAHEAGADVVKFQYWSSGAAMARRRKADAYLDIYRKFEIPLSWLPYLREAAESVGLQFACSVYLPGDAHAVAKFADILKVASFEASDIELLMALRAESSGHRILISLGMGASPRDASHLLPYAEFLHCVSAYPAPIHDLTLSKIRRPISGFSDHSDPSQAWTGALAVAAGARIIERHLRLDDTIVENPDYGHAMAPAAFRAYVENIRFAELAMGSADDLVGARESEKDMMQYRVTGC